MARRYAGSNGLRATDLKAAREAATLAERERCAKLVPMNWCDSLLTGKDAPNLPLDARGVEALLRGIQDRIRQAD
jgi:hypothetical protein